MFIYPCIFHCDVLSHSHPLCKTISGHLNKILCRKSNFTPVTRHTFNEGMDVQAQDYIIHKLFSFQDMVKLSDKLLEVCNKQVEAAKNHSMDKLCRGLTRLTNSRLVICDLIENIYINVSYYMHYYAICIG